MNKKQWIKFVLVMAVLGSPFWMSMAIVSGAVPYCALKAC